MNVAAWHSCRSSHLIGVDLLRENGKLDWMEKSFSSSMIALIADYPLRNASGASSYKGSKHPRRTATVACSADPHLSHNELQLALTMTGSTHPPS